MYMSNNHYLHDHKLMQQLNVHFERIEKTYCHVCCCWRLKENLEVLFSIDQSVHKLRSLKAAGQMGNGRSSSHKSAYSFFCLCWVHYIDWYCISHVRCLQFNSQSLLSLSLSLSLSLYPNSLTCALAAVTPPFGCYFWVFSWQYVLLGLNNRQFVTTGKNF